MGPLWICDADLPEAQTRSLGDLRVETQSTFVDTWSTESWTPGSDIGLVIILTWTVGVQVMALGENWESQVLNPTLDWSRPTGTRGRMMKFKTSHMLV